MSKKKGGTGAKTGQADKGGGVKVYALLVLARNMMVLVCWVRPHATNAGDMLVC